MTLVALTALVAGGAGVANAVRGLIERKRAAFAVLKALGAPATRVFAIAMTQVLLMAALAIALGLAIGAAIPYLAGAALERVVELPVVVEMDYAGLAIGALYGLLVTLVFSLGPLGDAHGVPVAALLRGEAEPSREKGPLRYRIAGPSAMLALVATVLLSASDKSLAGLFSRRRAGRLSAAARRRLRRDMGGAQAAAGQGRAAASRPEQHRAAGESGAGADPVDRRHRVAARRAGAR